VGTRLHLPSGPVGVLAGGVSALIAVAVMAPLRPDLSPATSALVLVLPGLIAARLGGRVAAGLVAIACALAYGVVFLPPLGAWKVGGTEDVVAGVVFVGVALAVGELTAREAVRTRVAEARARELEELTQRLEGARAERERLAREVDRLALVAEVDAARSALLRSVSHDLRTPLATIRAVSTDLQGDTPYEDETRRELLVLVSDEAERLDRLVSNLLSMSRVEAGSFAPELQAVDVRELLEATVQRLRRMVSEHRVELDVAADVPLVRADYTQIELVATNLLENAVRHATPRSTIRVGARSQGELVEVWVENQGEGVLPNERTTVFEPFHRGRGSRSSGIGLAICKAVVEAHGGTIRVLDVAGGGARFTFTLPVVGRAAPPLDASPVVGAP
jgi:K+-sensing histidine kinase KdpD